MPLARALFQCGHVVGSASSGAEILVAWGLFQILLQTIFGSQSLILTGRPLLAVKCLVQTSPLLVINYIKYESCLAANFLQRPYSFAGS